MKKLQAACKKGGGFYGGLLCVQRSWFLQQLPTEHVLDRTAQE